jgi:N12 class adenine-specific DNA methylase
MLRPVQTKTNRGRLATRAQKTQRMGRALMLQTGEPTRSTTAKIRTLSRGLSQPRAGSMHLRGLGDGGWPAFAVEESE